MPSPRRQLLCAVIASVLSGIGFAADPPAASDAGVWNAAFRYRFEGPNPPLRAGWVFPLSCRTGSGIHAFGVMDCGSSPQ